jgi:peptidoglycan/LPS O-acetylase OafA/YrhL
VVGVLGYEKMRPWGSFFLQYLWEFCLGMWIAEKVYKGNHRLMDIGCFRWWWLIGGVALGMGLTGLMAWNGGILKLYNDIPSLVGYLSLMLIIYKIGVSRMNRFFEWASGFGYELYLVHSLVFIVMAFFLKGALPLAVLLPLNFAAAYVAGYGYNCILKICRWK